ncbi:type II toxin-antitoxin system RelE/ParE family toxin [Propioniciclava sp. MC1683]|nr:type II toxin-antitoxin system RelE/ParE family toxin [Propioniciclava sp. MC1683]
MRRRSTRRVTRPSTGLDYSSRRELEGLYSARRGAFRIIYRISDVVTIMAIDHRADTYRSH